MYACMYGAMLHMTAAILNTPHTAHEREVQARNAAEAGSTEYDVPGI